MAKDGTVDKPQGSNNIKPKNTKKNGKETPVKSSPVTDKLSSVSLENTEEAASKVTLTLLAS